VSLAAPVERDDWETHWSAYAASASRNPAERMRIELVRGLLALPAGPVRLLDVGSGQGDLLAALTRGGAGVDAAGVELSSAGIEISQGKLPQARFVQRDLTVPGEPPDGLSGWATHATCSEVLEHVDEPVLLLENAMAFMAPGCRVVVTVPGGPRSAFDVHIGHRRHFTAAALREVLEQAGLDVQMVAGAGFPFFNLYRLVVCARGKRLVDDVREARGEPAGAAARAAMALFDRLFRLNLPPGRRGWQIVAVARVPTRP
jgi:SAM-dependent methyltransferase